MGITTGCCIEIGVPFIPNRMTQDSPALVIGTRDQKKLGQLGYHPLFKVNTIIKMLMERICTVGLLATVSPLIKV